MCAGSTASAKVRNIAGRNLALHVRPWGRPSLDRYFSMSCQTGKTSPAQLDLIGRKRRTNRAARNVPLLGHQMKTFSSSLFHQFVGAGAQ